MYPIFIYVHKKCTYNITTVGIWIDSNLEVMYALATQISFICPMWFNAFPMDIQVQMIFNNYLFTLRVFQICKFKVGSFNYPMSKITILTEVMY